MSGSFFSQNETSKWFFGNSAGLDFSTSPPTVVTTGSLTSIEGCSSQADASGNLLFYTDGVTIYDQTNAAMANGTGLNGNQSTTQSSVILKQPGSSTLYYVFTLGSQATGSLSYSIVDMSLSSGSGSVTVQNVYLASPCAEKLAAVKHCNKTDFWILCHDGSGTNFRSFLLTAAGLNTVSVVSAVGTFSIGDWAGYMKFSPNGKKLAVALYTSGLMEVYDFDNSSGVVSNPMTLSGGFGAGMYGCEFSPDGTKLYGGKDVNTGFFQWDLCAGSATAVAASVYSMTGTYNKAAMQLAPDGKIYVATPGQSSVGVVSNPNVAGSGCNFVEVSQSVSPKTSSYGLPNFMASYFYTPPLVPPFSYTMGAGFGCQTAFFTPPPVAQNYSLICNAVNYSVTSVLWNFGDPASGTNNTSTLTNPLHFFPSIGTYTTQLILYNNCSSDTLRQVVVISQPCITVNSSSITCASLGSATVNTTGTPGPFSYTWMPTGQTNPVATGLSPGSYTITLLDISSNMTYTASTVFTSSVPLTGYINNSDSVHCFGASTGTANVTSLAGGSGTELYSWTSGTTTLTAPSPTNLTAGNWTALVTDSLTGCTLTGGFFIRQPIAPGLALNASSPSVCAGGSVALIGTLSGGTQPAISYSWSGGAASSNYTLNLPVAGNFIYSLTAKDSYSCPITQTIGLTSVPNPTLSLISASICPFETGTLVVSGASTYSWNGISGSSTFTDTPLVNSSYTALGSALGCKATGVGSITIKPGPSPTIIQNSPVCEASAFILSAAGGTAYLWTGPQSFVSSAQNNTLNPVQLNQAGVYQLTVTAANSCTAPASTTLIVKPLPVVIITPSNSSMCLNIDTIALISSGTSTLFSWTPSLGLSATTNSSVSAFPTSTTAYTLTGSLNSCTAQSTATVNLVLPPNLGVALSSSIMCAQALSGSPNTIVLTASGANTYTISTPGHINNTNPSGPATSFNLMPPYQLTGAETATLSGSNGACVVSITKPFLTIPNPTVTVSSPTPVICAGQSYTYTSSGASSYTWSGSSPGNTIYTTGDVVVTSPTINSVFSVVGDSLGCFSAVKSSSITVNPLPVVVINPNPARVCLGGAVALIASGTGTFYSWSPNLFLNSDIGAVVLASPPHGQNYVVVSSLRGCTVSAGVPVFVLPPPVAQVSTSTPSVCLGGTISLQGGGGGSYSWTGPQGLSFSGAEITFNAFSTSYSGNYTLTVSDGNNCKASAIQPITVYNPPLGDFDPKGLEACAPFCAQLRFTSNANSLPEVAMNWQINGQSFSGANFQYCVSAPGNYPVTGTYRDVNNCVATYSAMIKAYPKPEADFSFLPERPLELLDQVQFSNESHNVTSFNWTFGNAGNVSTLPNPNFLFVQNGNYPVVLIVSNQWQCSDTIIKIITVLPDFAVYIPNTFTPNNDGLNDLFGPVFRGAKEYHISIVNRWGETIFQSSDFSKGWDGSYRGQPCEEDVYVWILDVTYQTTEKDKQSQHKTGSVLLYR